VANLKTTYTDGARRGFYRLGVILAGWGVTPDALTILGLVLNVASVPLIIAGHFLWAAVVFGLAALCDALDGSVARAGRGPTRSGAYLDSTLDRVSEIVTFGALAVFMAREDRMGELVAVLVVLGSGLMVSYARARAEALGVECRVGFMSRPERLVGLAIGFVFEPWGALPFMLYLMAVLTPITVVHRLVHVLRKLRAAERMPAEEADG
jgi:phosphatidylglycerophosphate synthase